MPLTVEEIEEKLIAEARKGGDRPTRDRILNDLVFWSEHFSTIVNEDAEEVPFIPRAAQLKMERAKQAQRAAGRPVRIIKLKARRVGSSVWDVNDIVHKGTTRPNRRALIVAQDNDTAAELFEVAETIYDNLPNRPWLKPGLVSRQSSEKNKFMHWGEPSRTERAQGNRGLNSRIKIDTAKEVSAGRGKTITDLLCTEAAFWPDPAKVLSLMPAVFERPDTTIVIESTANGHNAFKTRWDNAEKGLGGFVSVFISWLEDPNCYRAFDDEDQKQKFIEEEYGKGPYGEDEERLREKGATWEQLWWRRNAIIDKADGDLAKFKQEYPSTPLEAFIGSGKHVFSISLIEKAEEEAKLWNLPDGTPAPNPSLPEGEPQPGVGLLVAKDWISRPLAFGTMEVPTGALWVPESVDTDPEKPRWKVWQHPVKGGEGVKPGNYIVAVDSAAGEEMTATGDTDYHAIQVVDHETGEQVAEWRSRVDRDLLTLESILAAMYFNQALLAFETTGGYGLGPAEDARKKYAYNRLYQRRLIAQTRDKRQRALGWETTRKTKPKLEDNLAELLREGAKHPEAQVIRSLGVIQELKTYVRHENGRHGADTDQFDDLLMALMIALRIRDLERVPIALSGSSPAQPAPTPTPPRKDRYGHAR